MKKSVGTVIIDSFIGFLLLCMGFVTIYPFIFLLSASVSNPLDLIAGHVTLLPIGFSLNSYGYLMHSSDLWLAYYNTLWYTVVGVLVNVVMTVVFAFPLSRKDFYGRSAIMLFMAVPMFIGGSVNMIPSFILVLRLGLFDTRWAIIIPSMMSPMLVIMARIFFQSTIPDSLVEASRIDGASELRILARVVLPLSLPIVSVIVIYNIVIFWNVYTTALLYVPDVRYQPLQVYLQRILIANSPDAKALNAASADPSLSMSVAYQLRYSTIVVSIIPIVAMYPVLQKYFVQGSMMGAIKE